MKFSRKIIFLAIITLIALGAAAFGAYYFFFSKPTSPAMPKVSLRPLQTIQVPSWKTYKNTDFSFRYPDGWQLTTNKVNLGKVQFKNDIISYQSSAASSSGLPNSAVISIQNGKILGQDGKPLSFDSIVSQKFVAPIFEGPKKIQLGSKETIAYVNKNSGYLTNYLTIAYDGGAGNYYELAFDSVTETDLDYKSLFDQIINSFTFPNEK